MMVQLFTLLPSSPGTPFVPSLPGSPYHFRADIKVKQTHKLLKLLLYSNTMCEGETLPLVQHHRGLL